MRKGHRLGHETAERVAEQIDVLQAECIEECDGIIDHLVDGVRRRAAGGADAGVVEGDHVASGREAVDQRRVPVVDVSSEVLQQDDRDAVGRRRPDAAEHVGNPVGLNFLHVGGRESRRGVRWHDFP
jgi:hypothetical protein